MHIFISGRPSSGKTTLIKSLLSSFCEARGFFTQEIRRGGERVGFELITLKGEKVLFAHKDFSSPGVSKYGLDLKAFEDIGVKELEEALKDDCKIVVIDELGKMELCSLRFKKAILSLLEKKEKRIFATISIIKDSFLEKIRARKDVYILHLTKENFSRIKEEAELALKSLKGEQLRALEKEAKEMGLDERLLIENASSNLGEKIDALGLGKKGVVVAGRGNNGADVLSCARKLLSRGYEIKVVTLEEKPLGEEAQFQKKLLEKMGGEILSLFPNKKGIKRFSKILFDRDFILEGILGLGIRGEASSFYQEIISLINKSRKIIVSCDLPSGLSPDNGLSWGEAIRANYTITFLAPKEGFFLNQARNYCGKIEVVDIGISRQILEERRQITKEHIRGGG